MSDQAFPAAYCVGPNDDLYPPTLGMTLRDWFAGQALAGLMASANSDAAFKHALKHAAPMAFRLADAMLAARTPTDHTKD